MEWLQACPAADVAPESARLVDVGARKVLIVQSAGRFFASESRCPHLGVSLENGEIGAGAVRCRAHGYKLDLATGDCLSEKGLRLDVYRAELRDGWVWVELA
ncbi:MAG: Rieske (2Fe-2S) protein [Elusimicrobia bacterium]|nr:Rieske (2Fe-2S) protein [Elusimicrobiota bacterium]